MKNEQVLTVSEILNEISRIEKIIHYLVHIDVYNVQICYNLINDREFKNLLQNKIPFSLTVEIRKLILDSIQKHNTTILNLKKLLNQQK